eukprot:366336-Chlamydomonas_euryale.AAC.26
MERHAERGVMQKGEQHGGGRVREAPPDHERGGPAGFPRQFERHPSSGEVCSRGHPSSVGTQHAQSRCGSGRPGPAKVGQSESHTAARHLPAAAAATASRRLGSDGLPDRGPATPEDGIEECMCAVMELAQQQQESAMSSGDQGDSTSPELVLIVHRLNT